LVSRKEMGQSVGEPARVLLLFSSLLFLGTVGRVNTIGAGRASENHNHRVLEFLDVVKGHAEFRVSDKPVQGHFLGVADQQLRNEYPWVSRRLLQSNGILETSEEHKEVPFEHFLSTIQLSFQIQLLAHDPLIYPTDCLASVSILHMKVISCIKNFCIIKK
jgi:hypothetical protein